MFSLSAGDERGTRGSISAIDDEDGTVGEPDDAVDGAAEQRSLEFRSTLRSHDDEIYVPIGCDRDDLLVRGS